MSHFSLKRAASDVRPVQLDRTCHIKDHDHRVCVTKETHWFGKMGEEII